MNQQGNNFGNGWKGAHLKVAGNTLCKTFIRGSIKQETIIIGENIAYKYFVLCLIPRYFLFIKSLIHLDSVILYRK